MSQSLERIGYLGPPGTFGELAALGFGQGSLVPLPSHAGVVAAVGAGMVEVGILPVENSVEGSVSESLDLLIQEADLAIVGERIVPIEQCLLVRPGTRTGDVAVVFSHPQALGQCRAFLERCFPRARLEASLSTAAAVEELSRHEGAAAIASSRAAELFGAEVLARGIQDRRNNVTRFVAIARPERTLPPTGRDKTSLAFKTPHDRPGTLLEVLSEFAARAINLTKIESRPSKDALGIYVFLVDLEGHQRDRIVAEALDAVGAKTSWLKVLGSYPRAMDPQGPGPEASP